MTALRRVLTLAEAQKLQGSYGYGPQLSERNGTAELSKKDQKFWVDFWEDNQRSCFDILEFLDEIRATHDPSSSAPFPTPPWQALEDLRKRLPKKIYPKLFRGFTPSKSFAVGTKQRIHFKEASFWSQDKGWAKDFAAEKGDVLAEIVGTQAPILCDFNLIPFVFGPVGREPELLLNQFIPLVTILAVTK